MAGGALGVALLCLTLGWGAGFDVFVRVAPSLPAMVPASALCLALLAVAQLTSLTEHRVARLAGAAILAATVPLIVVLSQVGPDWLHPTSTDLVSVSTVFGVSVVALAQVVARMPEGRRHGLHSTVALVGVFLSGSGLSGFLIDREALNVQAPFIGLSVLTALCLFLLSLSIIFSCFSTSILMIF